MPLVHLQEVICCSVTQSVMVLIRLSKVTVSPVGYNKSALTSSDAFTGHKTSSTSSKVSSISSSAHNKSSSSCCFVVQDTIDVRYWTSEYT